MKILISACLLGVACQYNGNAKPLENLDKLMAKHTLIPVCPECLGGLPTPRPPSEISKGKVISNCGVDVTEQFIKGAEVALQLAKLYDIDCAILKERSPSCGFGKIYDGTFTSTIIEGNGLTADILAKNGIKVIGETQISELL